CSSRSLQIEGQTEPIVAYAVEQAVTRPQKPRGIEGLGAELVGRAEELAKLWEVYFGMLRGSGQIVSLIGEAGVGKSRLVSELKVEASEARSEPGRARVPADWAGREGASGEPLLPGRGGVSAALRPPLWLEG